MLTNHHNSRPAGQKKRVARNSTHLDEKKIHCFFCNFSISVSNYLSLWKTREKCEKHEK
jgi:hypothetical protein